MNIHQKRLANDPIYAARCEFDCWGVACQKNGRAKDQECSVFRAGIMHRGVISARPDGTFEREVIARDEADSAAMVAAIGVAIGPGLRRILVTIAGIVADYEKLCDAEIAIDLQFGSDENSSMPITAGEVRNLAKWAAGLSAPPFEDVRHK